MGNIIASQFQPAWWLRNPHLQTLWPTFFRRRPRLALDRQRVELPDGDFLDLACAIDRGRPMVVVIHGLEGSLHSHYAGATLAALQNAGFDAVFMHLRGCSGEPNRLARSYHSGASEDLRAVLGYLQHRRGRPVAGVVGFSLGGNLLLKFLGEAVHEHTLRAAVAVSVPFSLMDCAQRLESGVSRLYRNHLMKSLVNAYEAKFRQTTPPLAVDTSTLKGFYQFDDQVTAPLNGFDGADDYYRQCSSRGYMRTIVTPTLVLHSLDDPFMNPQTVPQAAELGPGVTLELSPRGGHVGFVGGPIPGRAAYWTDTRIPEFFTRQLG